MDRPTNSQFLLGLFLAIGTSGWRDFVCEDVDGTDEIGTENPFGWICRDVVGVAQESDTGRTAERVLFDGDVDNPVAISVN